MEQSIKLGILKTLAYFDIFNYPLTALEIWRYFYWPNNSSAVSPSLADIEVVLSEANPLIKSHEGFYFLATRPESIVASRKERYLIAENKFKKVKKIGKYLASLPYVQLIAVCNTLSYSNAGINSDIDLFIVAAANKVWTARTLLLIFLTIFGLRPKAKNSADKFCLSFFVDEEHLNLEPLALPRDDIHFVYWLEQFYPVYDAGSYYQRLRQQNSWLNKFLPNATGVEPNLRRVIVLGWLAKTFKHFGERILKKPWWEEFLGSKSFTKMPRALREKVNQDVGVIIRNGVIKLITNDRRIGYRNEWVVKANGLKRE